MAITLKAGEFFAYYVDCLLNEKAVQGEDVHEAPSIEAMKEEIRGQVLLALNDLAAAYASNPW